MQVLVSQLVDRRGFVGAVGCGLGIGNGDGGEAHPNCRWMVRETLTRGT